MEDILAEASEAMVAVVVRCVQLENIVVSRMKWAKP